MNLYAEKRDTAAQKKVVLEDMILTCGGVTTAGSKMLDGYESLFGATVIEKLEGADYGICGKAKVGEFALDLLAETCAAGASVDENGRLVYPTAEIIKQGEADGALTFDVNGAARRGSAVSGLTCVKPTYGIVSRFGTIPVACSGETVGVMAKTADECEKLLTAIVGHDDKDGTAHPEEICRGAVAETGEIKKIALITAMRDIADEQVKAKINEAKAKFEAAGVTVEEIDGELLLSARVAWNALMCAEMCNNVSKYDGIKYGYRTANYTTIGELYTNSRTEAFGDMLKSAILFGSETLSTENYMKVYDKSLRVRRVISEYLSGLFWDHDAVLMPATSKLEYSKADTEANRFIAFEENVYTAPASVTGCPAVVTAGVQLLGKAFSDGKLLKAAIILEGEEK